MPTYDYECDACGHEFELFQSISENVKRKCPECGKQKLRRLFGTGAAIGLCPPVGFGAEPPRRLGALVLLRRFAFGRGFFCFPGHGYHLFVFRFWTWT